MVKARKRGRPKSIRPDIDCGTPELQAKRQLHLTSEPLDMCLKQGYINDVQHWCGIHLRWLYTLRYGAPGLRPLAMNALECPGGLSDDSSWRAAREQEYHDALIVLTRHQAARPMLNLCVFNIWPAFLIASDRVDTIHDPSLTACSVSQGLQILVHHWR